MRRDKEYIFKLRQEGKTYRQIQKETGVSRATLSVWFKDITWSKHMTSSHREVNRAQTYERIKRMNMVRKLKLQYYYALVESEAVKEYETFKKDPLFWAGLMIYAGEGDKRSRAQIRVSNVDFYIHRIFSQFTHVYLKISPGEVKYGLLVYPDLDEAVCKKEWMEQLSISPEQFHKTQVIKGKESIKRLQYGVGMSIITNTSRKKKLIKWLTLAAEEQFTQAGMVQG